MGFVWGGEQSWRRWARAEMWRAWSWRQLLTQGSLGGSGEQTLTRQCPANVHSESKHTPETFRRACEDLSFLKVKQTVLWFLAQPCNLTLPGVNVTSSVCPEKRGWTVLVLTEPFYYRACCTGGKHADVSSLDLRFVCLVNLRAS